VVLLCALDGQVTVQNAIEGYYCAGVRNRIAAHDLTALVGLQPGRIRSRSRFDMVGSDLVRLGPSRSC